jgi:hypothetical protein
MICRSRSPRSTRCYFAALSYSASDRPHVEPGATSSFDLAAYEAVRQTWLYDPAFDLVVVASDGSFVGVLHRLVRSSIRDG